MLNILFIMGFCIFLTVLFVWSFRNLPGSKGQFLAALPMDPDRDGQCSGRNLTYYGLLIAFGGMMGAALLIILLASISVNLRDAALLMILIFTLCVPSSRIIARLVEKKRNTFTVGGASFLGIVTTPPAIWLMNKYLGDRYGVDLPLVATLAAFSIAYALGEGLGRLGCISFGCCYGKPLSDLDPLWRNRLSNWSMVFQGKTKKVSYAGGLEGERLVPVQSMSALALSASAVTGVFLFLNGLYVWAFLCCMVVSQVWRAFSETLRADYRGGGRISSYQYMAMLGLIISLAVIYFAPSAPLPEPDIIMGIQALWSPWVIIFLQAMGLIMFLYFGLSTVTESKLSFGVLKERV